MKALKIVGLVLVALVVLCVGIGLFLPRSWSVSRSILIQAPPEQIHPWVDSPAKWKEWFDFTGMGEEMQVTVSGPERGVGATYEWTMPGSRGRLVITESDAKTGIYIDEWIESDEKNARGSIAYTAAEGGATRVTWTDQGTLPPVIGGYVRGMVDAAVAPRSRRDSRT